MTHSRWAEHVEPIVPLSIICLKAVYAVRALTPSTLRPKETEKTGPLTPLRRAAGQLSWPPPSIPIPRESSCCSCCYAPRFLVSLGVSSGPLTAYYSVYLRELGLLAWQEKSQLCGGSARYPPGFHRICVFPLVALAWRQKTDTVQAGSLEATGHGCFRCRPGRRLTVSVSSVIALLAWDWFAVCLLSLSKVAEFGGVEQQRTGRPSPLMFADHLVCGKKEGEQHDNMALELQQ